MVSEKQIAEYLAKYGYDEARRKLIAEHHYMDQTIDMKLTQLEQVICKQDL